MPNQQRPDPEALLQRVQSEEREASQGKLKIYLGAAPGVGKTYTMLQDAIEKLSQGLDIVVGVVESHGRKEIQALISRFDILPRKDIEYRDRTLQEFDLDAAIKRNPGLILMDEMAHTNAPGLQHEKRWQDIKELLDRGLDVYTTLNVQHIESLNDIILQITNITVKETVPDSMLEIAHTIELVDLPPDDLLRRLEEGKVYFPKQAELARESFFRMGNLIALRELALRITAERVGTDVLLYRHDQGIRRIWPTKEKILVCVGHHTGSARLIRAAKRMAVNLQAEWMAIYVDSARFRTSEEKRKIAIQNLSLAGRLGAQTHILTGLDLVKEIMDFAHEKNITQIIVGKEIRPRWRGLFMRSLADEVVRQSGEIDVYIMTREVNRSKRKPVSYSHPTIPWNIYGYALGIIGVITGIGLLIQGYVSDANVIMLYLFGVILIALFGQLAPAVIGSLLSVIAYAVFFVPPHFSFSIANIQYDITLTVMLISTLLISQLTVISRRQALEARLAEQRASTLYTLSHKLASLRGVDKIIDAATQYLSEIFNANTLILLPKEHHLIIRGEAEKKDLLSEKEQAVAQWVYELGQRAGIGTDNLPSSEALYVPLLALQGTIGVLRVKPAKQLLTYEQLHLLEACANQIALAIEVDRLQDKRKKSEWEFETRQTRHALLQSVSRDLDFSLVKVKAATSRLLKERAQLGHKLSTELIENIYVESEEISHLINNLLQISHLETERLALKKESHSLHDIVTIVIDLSCQKLTKKEIKLNIPEKLPNTLVDKALIQEVFLNLIDNAVKFSTTETPILINIVGENDKIITSVEDQGIGIAPDEVNKLFDKFYRGRMTTTQRGVGLGLTICRMIIEAHGGKIWAQNRNTGGAVFYFSLPVVK
ncbi:MAG: sensor histidine kinase KdpD [Gammaproteobacteria bacterium]|nr:sensor histidine kinase KdpD [Gammaproteobacteria bacterium]